MNALTVSFLWIPPQSVLLYSFYSRLKLTRLPLFSLFSRLSIFDCSIIQNLQKEKKQVECHLKSLHFSFSITSLFFCSQSMLNTQFWKETKHVISKTFFPKLRFFVFIIKKILISPALPFLRYPNVAVYIQTKPCFHYYKKTKFVYLSLFILESRSCTINFWLFLVFLQVFLGHRR